METLFDKANIHKEAFRVLKELYHNHQRQKYPNVPEHAFAKPTFTDKNTNGLTKCIISFINLSGYQAERINSEGRLIDTRESYKDILGNTKTIGSVKRIKSSTQKGTADISATIKGLSVKVEVKCFYTKDRQRPDQKEYQKKIEQAGGIYFIAHSFPQFYEWYLMKFGGQ